MPGLRGLVGLVLVTAALLALVAGCARYGGIENVVDRARSKISEYRPHPDLVPTPFSEALAAPVSLPAAGTDNTGVGGGDGILPALPALVTATPGMATPKPVSTITPTVATASPVPTTAPSATPTATPAAAPAQPAVMLTNIAHYWQTWNNCGPATLAMDLSYFGSTLDQTAVAATLRPDKDDKNTRPDEMAAFAQSQGLHALVRVTGDPVRLKELLSNKVPVIIETWMEPKPNDGMGHYRLLVGYDDATREWIAYDSYDARGVDPNKPYAGIRLPYDELPSLWHVYDNTYIVVYGDQAAPAIAAILGEDMTDQTIWQRAMSATEQDLKAQPRDAFGWFNLGSELLALNRPTEAVQAYDAARQIGLPWRMLWYQFGPFQAYYTTAHYDEVVALADATLKTADNIEELYYWKGMALQAQGDRAGARQAWERAVQLNKNYRAPAEALAASGQGG